MTREKTLIAQAQKTLLSQGIEIEPISSSEEKKFAIVEEKLYNLFEKYKKQDDPVFLYIKGGLIQKMAYFLCGANSRPVSLGVAGASASGKSTIAFNIIECIQNFEQKHKFDNLITRVNTDDYYYDRSKEVIEAGGFDNFVKNYDLDSPNALELDLLCEHIQKLKKGKDVWLPKYDMSGTAKRHNNHTAAEPGKIVVTEGLFTLTDKVRDAFDFKIFVHVDEEIQKQRWFTRAKERGIEKSVDEMYENIMTKAKRNIEPTKEHADLVVNGDISRIQYKMFVTDILDIVESSIFTEV